MFKSRSAAGALLAAKLQDELEGKAGEEAIVLGIPRGGVVTGHEIASTIDAQLDVIITKKLSAPNRKELAIGAVGQTEGSLYVNEGIVSELSISREYIAQEVKVKQLEIERREQLYRGERQELALTGKRVIVADDGAATGATMVAAVREVWNRQPKQVIIAVPVCAKNTLQLFEQEADMVVVLETPVDFFAVGQFYEEFEQVGDEEVIQTLSFNVIASNA